MTTSPTWTVWCDAELDGCPMWCQQTDATAKQARENARTVGWHWTGGRDICPSCWEKGAR